MGVQVRAKKAQMREKRKQEARQKVFAAVVAAVAQGFMQETQKNLTIEKPEYEKQIQRVWRWSNECLDKIELGKRSIMASTRLLHALDAQVQADSPPGVPKTVGDYAVVWLAIGFLADEIKHMIPTKQWNYLASVTNTWGAMVLDQAPADGTDYESRAGDLAEGMWYTAFEQETAYFT